MTQLQTTLDEIINASTFSFGTVEITTAPIIGGKVGYAHKFNKGTKITGRIVIDNGFYQYCIAKHLDELKNTIAHEVAHLVAENRNTKAKHVWHGQAWKDLHIELGGTGERYYSGSFTKPGAPVKMTLEQLYKIQPTQPKDTWTQGTYNQWLRRGYHIIKGQKGTLKVWQFIGNEYETADGQTAKAGRQSAFYWTPEQVEPNKPKDTK